MAFPGIASLIGVIISHVIVLFDFIEETHEKNEPFEQAIRDPASVTIRCRPKAQKVGIATFSDSCANPSPDSKSLSSGLSIADLLIGVSWVRATGDKFK
jgi:hypothetical protein